MKYVKIATNVRMVEWYTHWFQKSAPNGMRVQVSLLILIWQVIVILVQKIKIFFFKFHSFKSI